MLLLAAGRGFGVALLCGSLVWVAFALGRRLHLAFPSLFPSLGRRAKRVGGRQPRASGETRKHKLGALNYTYIVSP